MDCRCGINGSAPPWYIRIFAPRSCAACSAVLMMSLYGATIRVASSVSLSNCDSGNGCQSKVVSRCAQHCEPRLPQVALELTLALAPRSNGNQMRVPLSLRAPSHIMLTAFASAGERQLVAGAPRWPQTLALASKVHLRGSPRMPSTTPSMASHAAMAEVLAAANFWGVTVPPAMSLLTHQGQSVITCRRVL